MTSADLEALFTFYPVSNEGAAKSAAIRAAAKTFALVVLNNTPACADQTAALRKVREAVYTANAALAATGK